MASTRHGLSDRETQLLRETHEVLDTLEHHLKTLHTADAGCPLELVDRVLALRRKIFEVFPEPPSSK